MSRSQTQFRVEMLWSVTFAKGQAVSRFIRTSAGLEAESGLCVEIRIRLHMPHCVCSWYDDRLARWKVKGYFITLFRQGVYCSNSL